MTAARGWDDPVRAQKCLQGVTEPRSRGYHRHAGRLSPVTRHGRYRDTSSGATRTPFRPAPTLDARARRGLGGHLRRRLRTRHRIAGPDRRPDDAGPGNQRLVNAPDRPDGLGARHGRPDPAHAPADDPWTERPSCAPDAQAHVLRRRPVETARAPVAAAPVYRPAPARAVSPPPATPTTPTTTGGGPHGSGGGGGTTTVGAPGSGTGTAGSGSGGGGLGTGTTGTGTTPGTGGTPTGTGTHPRHRDDPYGVCEHPRRLLIGPGWSGPGSPATTARARHSRVPPQRTV